jgi:hypothetical protein
VDAVCHANRKRDIPVPQYVNDIEAGILERRKTLILAIIIIALVITGVIQYSILGISVHNVSAVELQPGLGVYWDVNCTQPVLSVDWGRLSPGNTKNVTVYVRNEGNESNVLVVAVTHWNPVNASQYLTLQWSPQYPQMNISQVVNVALKLSISRSTVGISSFSFGIIFSLKPPLLGDVNKDGVVNIRDVVLVILIYRSTPSDPDWNPSADLNNDGIIDTRDITMVLQNFGVSLG